MTADPLAMTLEQQYAEVLRYLHDAEVLAEAGSQTAAREVGWANVQLRALEERLKVEHRGPAPIETPPPTPALKDLHEACVTLIESDTRTERRDALGALLPHVSRGQDLAFLLGYQVG